MADESHHDEESKIQIEQLLRQMNDDWVKAMVRRDAETLDRIMAPDFFFTYPMEGDDKSQFIGDVTSGDLAIEHITRDHISVRIFGSTAVLTALDSAKWIYKGRPLSGHYKIIHVYSERNSHWQLVAVQACPIP